MTSGTAVELVPYDPDDMAAYATLKQGLAEQYLHDGDRYTAGKRHFVDAIIEKALRASQG